MKERVVVQPVYGAKESYFAGIVGPLVQPVVIRSLGYKAKNQQVALSISISFSPWKYMRWPVYTFILVGY
jgi:hypothetical protein